VPEFKISRFDAHLEDQKILSQYSQGMNKIFITEDGGYFVQEPKLSFEAENIWKGLMENLHNSFTFDIIEKVDIIPILKKTLEDESRKTDNFEKWKKEKELIEYYLERDLVGYSVLDVFMRDKHIEDILCVRWNKPMLIVHNQFYDFTLLKTNIIFNSEEEIKKLIQRISQNYGDPPTDIHPMTSFADENNIRFSFTGNRTITPDGPTISIRKPSISSITIYHLLTSRVLTTLAAAYLWIMIDLQGFGLIIGSPASGKTTLINAMFTMANPSWHYFTIEDVLELKLTHDNVSRHQTQANSSIQGEEKKTSSIGIFDLCRLSLRFRPDSVIVGEVLGQEAEGLFQVAASGSGCISSFHASDPRDTLTRLESPPINISKTQTGLISHILHISWISKKNKRYRRVLKITEPVPVPNDIELRKDLVDVFEYDSSVDKLMPDNVDTLVKYSEKLKKAKTKLGIQDIAVDLKKRMEILDKIVNEKISTPESISKEIFKYYNS